MHEIFFLIPHSYAVYKDTLIIKENATSAKFPSFIKCDTHNSTVPVLEESQTSNVA
jgi:hypothetical protein